MRLYIKQKVFSWKDKFTVYDESGKDKYYVEGKLFSLGKKLNIYDLSNNEVARIEQKLLSFLPKYFVYSGDMQIAEIVRKFTFLKPKYEIEGLGWDVNGDFFAHDYEITQHGRAIVTIRKQWFTWGDCYELDIVNESDEIIALAVVLAIDCVMAASQAAAASSST